MAHITNPPAAHSSGGGHDRSASGQHGVHASTPKALTIVRFDSLVGKEITGDLLTPGIDGLDHIFSSARDYPLRVAVGPVHAELRSFNRGVEYYYPMVCGVAYFGLSRPAKAIIVRMRHDDANVDWPHFVLNRVSGVATEVLFERSRVGEETYSLRHPDGAPIHSLHVALALGTHLIELILEED